MHFDRCDLLALDLADPGFDRGILSGFRGRLLGNAAVDRLLARVLDAAREDELPKARGRRPRKKWQSGCPGRAGTGHQVPSRQGTNTSSMANRLLVNPCS